MTARHGSGRVAVAWLTGQSLVFGAMAALLGIVANTMFIDAYGSAWLPATYIAIGAAGIAVSGAVARAAQRFDLVGIAVAVLGVAAATLGAAWLLAAGGDAAWVSVPLLVLFPILIQLGFVFIGGQGGRLLDIAGIKASFPRIMAGFPVGAVAGGLLGAELVARLGRTEDLLLATAVSQAAFTGLVWATGRRFGDALRLPKPAPGSGHRGPTDDAERTGLAVRRLLGSRLVALILAYQVLSAVGSQLADFLVFDRAAAAYADPADLARYLAGYTAAMNGASIGFLVLLAGPLLRRFGLRLGIAANPVALTLFGGAMVAVNAVSGGTSLALLWVVSAARISDIALTDGTTRTSINAMYQVIPERSRLPVQTAVEGIGVPVAIGISGVLVLTLNALPFALTATIVVTTLLCVAWTWVGFLLYRAYGPALVGALQRRPLLVPVAHLDTTAEDEVAARHLLSSTDPREARVGLDMLTTMSAPGLEAELDALAHDPRPDVRLAALAALAASGDAGAGDRLADEVALLLEDEDSAVRRAALAAVQPTHAFAVGPVVAALRDPSSAAVAAGAVGRLGDAVLPALAEALASAGAPGSPVAMRLVRAVTTRSPTRDAILRRHVDHCDRELALAVTERLIAAETADAEVVEMLGAVLVEDARHASRILQALAALEAVPGRPVAVESTETDAAFDAALRRAMVDELDLMCRKVRADVLARHGAAGLGPAMVELGPGGPAGVARSSAALAVEAMGVLLSARESRLVLALLQPGLSVAERLGKLPEGLAGDGPTDLAGLLRDLVEDRRDQWRSSWLRACAIAAAKDHGLLGALDLRPARALGDPIIDEVLAGT